MVRHVAADRIDEPGADRGADLADVQRVAGRGALQRRVAADRQVGLGDADRKAAEAVLLVAGQLRVRGRRVRDLAAP